MVNNVTGYKLENSFLEQVIQINSLPQDCGRIFNIVRVCFDKHSKYISNHSSDKAKKIHVIVDNTDYLLKIKFSEHFSIKSINLYSFEKAIKSHRGLKNLEHFHNTLTTFRLIKYPDIALPQFIHLKNINFYITDTVIKGIEGRVNKNHCISYENLICCLKLTTEKLPRMNLSEHESKDFYFNIDEKVFKIHLYPNGDKYSVISAYYPNKDYIQHAVNKPDPIDFQNWVDSLPKPSTKVSFA